MLIKYFARYCYFLRSRFLVTSTKSEQFRYSPLGILSGKNGARNSALYIFFLETYLSTFAVAKSQSSFRWSKIQVLRQVNIFLDH